MRLRPRSAIIVGISIAIAMLVWERACKADELPDTRAMMVRVEAALVAQGYRAEGYASERPPVVTLEAELPARDWGSYVPEHIKLSAEQPVDCLRISLAHELSHDAVVRRNLIDVSNGVPVWFIRAELERIASIVERAVADDGPFVPNCLLRRSAS